GQAPQGRRHGRSRERQHDRDYLGPARGDQGRVAPDPGAVRGPTDQGGGKVSENGTTPYRADPPPTLIELVKVGKVFLRGKEEVRVLEGLDLTIHEGAFEALIGPSGS